jgi:multidrug efflux system membrane fusion protein
MMTQKAAAEYQLDSGGSLNFLRNRRFASIAILAVAGVIVYLLVMRSSRAGGAVASVDTGAHHAAIPVTTVAARIGDLDRYLTGLGTVTPFNTVTLKTRVDGQIMRIDFHRGSIGAGWAAIGRD